jgi:hypothetical protein
VDHKKEENNGEVERPRRGMLGSGDTGVMAVAEDGRCRDELRILYTNIDGVSNKMDELTLRMSVSVPDVVGLCETMLKDSVGNEGFPPKYAIIRNDREDRSGGGLSMLVRNEFTAVVRDDYSLLETGIVQYLWCDLYSSQGDKLVLLGLVYRPPTRLLKMIQNCSACWNTSTHFLMMFNLWWWLTSTTPI